MTCANTGITIFSLIILVLTIWPGIFTAEAVKWIIIIASLLIIITVWAGCECKCERIPKGKKK